MAELYGILATIALLDSVSMITVTTVPILAMMSSQRPVQATMTFIVSTFIVYYACGILVFMGLDGLFDAIGYRLEQWWTHPDATDLIFELAIGLLMIVIAFAMMQPDKKSPKRQPKSMSPVGVFAFAAVLVVVGMPGAVPYFAAIDMMLRADLSDVAAAWALFYYSAIFVLPLVAIVVVRVALGDRSKPIFAAVNRFLEHWGKRVVIIVLLLLGMVLLADSIGWLLGRSFIPID